ncbi:MAG: hypothetical protein IJI67_06130 [Clostridia bacterium]|nr:hypothetical protein [Clostridia bacterium]
MKDWKQLFQPQILERGYDYYRDSAVDEITKRGNTYSATVCGSEEYEVEITVKEGAVTAMFCDCPYAAIGNCKHMAAMLYELEAYRKDDIDFDDSKLKSEFSAKLEKMSKQELIKFISSNADNEMMLKLLSSSSVGAKKQLAGKMCRQFDSIIKNYTYADGTIDYQNAYRFCNKLGEFIYPTLSTFLKDIGHMETFEFILHCAEDLSYLEYEDYDCGLYEIENELEYYLEEVIQKSTREEKESIRKTLKRFMSYHTYSFSEEVEEWVDNK